jgi:hypothetical protein
MPLPPKKPHRLVYILLFVLAITSCKNEKAQKDYVLGGTLKKWQPVTLTFDGPFVSEKDGVNPFLDYSLWVNFYNREEQLSVPGYFAADGDAANTSAVGGNKWQVKFSPYAVGEWSFDAYLMEGKEIAVQDFVVPKKDEELWKVSGSFEVQAVDSTVNGFHGTGKLAYVEKHYLEESETGKSFLKNGLGSPENFLAFHEFDGTYDNGGAATPTLRDGLHEFPTHIADWKRDDPTWAGGKGKALIGALNYMASKGLNSLYFMTMNVHGDGDDVWPWIAPDEQRRFDVSKLAQWDKVFAHMDQLGIAMNVFTQETENDTILNKGELGLERKLFYKELVARFGHHLGVVWNLGEETNRSSKQLKSYASYIRSIDPYDHPIAVHNHVRVTGERREGRPLDPIKETFTPLLGFADFELPSLQMYDTTEVHKEVIKWLDLSKKEKKPWVVYVDEIGHWDIGVTTDTAANNNYDMVMRTSLWGSLMAGGAGNSWYFGGLDTPNNDMAAENFRARDQWWTISNNARSFFVDHLPFWEMRNHDELLSNQKAFCFAKKDEIYVVYLPKGETTDLEIGEGAFTIGFYDPKEGGKIYDKQNEGWEITKPNSVSLSAYNGQKNKDWVIVIMGK